MATSFTGILPLTGDVLIDSMTTGYRWNSDGPIFYSFSDGFDGEYWTDPTYVATQLQTIFDVIDYYVAADFSYVGYFDTPAQASQAGSDINISIDGTVISEFFGDNVLAVGLFPNPAFAEGYLEDYYYAGAEGDVYLNINSEANSYGFEAGQAGFSLALHEIGHALGLKHPHDNGGTGHPTFQEAGYDGLDIDWLTVMSYDDDYNWNGNAWDPATPMILDVIALQYLYGANTSTNSGDSVYTVDSDTGFYTTIFDASGNDTLDLSAYKSGAYIDLPKYVVSDAQYAPFGMLMTLEDSERTSSPHSLQWVMGDIERVVGSAFGDLIDGSSSAEIIEAGGGFDEVYVGGGNDTVDGGEGSDWVYFLADFEDCDISFEGDTCIVESDLDGRNTLTNVEALIFDYTGNLDFREIDQLRSTDVPSPSDTVEWQLIASDGYFASIGGNGQVYGTSQFQAVFIADIAGSISLDPSFNRGGDILFLTGQASDWQVVQSGTAVIMFDGDTFLEVPVGGNGLVLDFDDGDRLLKIDTQVGAIKIGDQSIGEEYAPISAPAEDIAIPPGYDPDAFGRLLLSEGGTVMTGGNVEIFGTADSEQITMLSGTAILDPSFNRGGDTLLFVGDSTDFQASVVGSSVLIEGEDYEVEIPVGSVAMDLSFFDATGSLYYDTSLKSVVIGDQAIGETPAPLTFA